jgi:hypothetical protein
MGALHVRVENPDTGGVWDCPVDYLPVAKARGWIESDKPLAGEGEEYPAEPPTAKAAAPKDAPTREAKPSTSAKAKATKTSPKE